MTGVDAGGAACGDGAGGYGDAAAGTTETARKVSQSPGVTP